DLVYHADQSRLEYDFVVAPGASPGSIVLEFRGASSTRVRADGSLAVQSGDGEVSFGALRVLQDGKLVHGRYRLLGRHRVGFHVERYDRGRPLIIDPVLGYAALFGSQGSDPIQSVAVDSAG